MPGENPGNGISLTDHHENNKILSHHIRNASRTASNPEDAIDHQAKLNKL